MAPTEMRRSRAVTTGNGFLIDVVNVAGVEKSSFAEATADKSGATASVSWISGVVWTGWGKDPVVGSLGIA